MTLRPVLIGMTVLDLCLVAVLGHDLRQRRDDFPTPAVKESPAGIEDRAKSRPNSSSAALPASLGRSGRSIWGFLRSSDMQTYVENLRRAQFPEDMVIAIITAEVDRRFASQERALKFRLQDRHPWEAPSSQPLAVFERQRKLRQLVREKEALLSGILGYEVKVEVPEFAAPPHQERYDAVLERLPDEKRGQARQIQEKYWEAVDALRSRTLGFLGADDRQELERLKTQRREALKGVLEKPELEDLDLETSRLADDLRSRLSGFEVSDEEFRRAFRRAQAADDQGSQVDEGRSPSPGKNRSQATGMALDQQIRAALGDGRYAELARSRSPEFRNLARITEAAGLPAERALEAYEVQQKLQQDLRRLAEDGGLSDAERENEAIRLNAEAELALLQILGQAGLQVLKAGPIAPKGRSRR